MPGHLQVATVLFLPRTRAVVTVQKKVPSDVALAKTIAAIVCTHARAQIRRHEIKRGSPQRPSGGCREDPVFWLPSLILK
jgi:hypothetical protein